MTRGVLRFVHCVRCNYWTYVFQRRMIRRMTNNYTLLWMILLSAIISASGEVIAASQNMSSIPDNNIDARVRSSTKIAYPDPVTNLTVKAEVYNSGRRLLQLAVSWIPPVGGERPDSYNMHVEPSDQNNECKSLSYYKHISDMNATNASVPDYVDVINDFWIIPGCTYKIVVESNPHDGKKNASLKYTLPECVADICSCHHAPGLPVPTDLTARIVGIRSLNVSWNISAPIKGDTINITNFIVYFGHQIPVLKDKHIYNMSPAGDLKYSRGTLHPSLVIDVPLDFTPNVTYMVQVSVMDNRSCKGPRTNFTFSMPAPPTGASNHSSGFVDRTSLQWVLITVLPVLSFVVVSIIAVIMVWHRCGGWICRKLGESRLQPICCHGVYKPVNRDSTTIQLTTNFPSHRERNIIYVEKEIEDARARGDADTFEICHSRLELGRLIGKGAFGEVFLARAEAIAGIRGYSTIAVKKLKNKANSDEVEEFLSEIAMMKRVGRHPNIVTMLGCCTLKQPYCMLMEYVPCGDLLQYLRQLRVEYDRYTGGRFELPGTMIRPLPPGYIDVLFTSTDSEDSYVQPETHITSSSGHQTTAETEWTLLSSVGAPLMPIHMTHKNKLEYVLDPKELQNFAIQIARGMLHLEKKQITHRDLAARNVLIDEHKTLKISDFGLSRSGIYINTKRKKVPLRWLSVEAMRDNLYSSKSDVWAFAIVLWEIGTLGGFPYPTVGDMDLLNFLLDGKRLEKPDNVSEELYSLMLHCWSHSADMRPSFAELVSHLESVICRKRVYVDFTSLKPNYSFPPTEQQIEAPIKHSK